MNSISIYSPLPELGMDSISGLEVKQTLEQQYDIFFSPKELISLTFAELEIIQRTGRKSNGPTYKYNYVFCYPEVNTKHHGTCNL